MKTLPNSEKARRIHFEMDNIGLRNSIDRVLRKHPKLWKKILDMSDAYMCRKRRSARP
jgi:hypothetical protein